MPLPSYDLTPEQLAELRRAASERPGRSFGMSSIGPATRRVTTPFFGTADEPLPAVPQTDEERRRSIQPLIEALLQAILSAATGPASMLGPRFPGEAPARIPGGIPSPAPAFQPRAPARIPGMIARTQASGPPDMTAMLPAPAPSAAPAFRPQATVGARPGAMMPRPDATEIGAPYFAQPTQAGELALAQTLASARPVPMAPGVAPARIPGMGTRTKASGPPDMTVMETANMEPTIAAEALAPKTLVQPGSAAMREAQLAKETMIAKLLSGLAGGSVLGALGYKAANAPAKREPTAEPKKPKIEVEVGRAEIEPDEPGTKSKKRKPRKSVESEVADVIRTSGRRRESDMPDDMVGRRANPATALPVSADDLYQPDLAGPDPDFVLRPRSASARAHERYGRGGRGTY